jgi:hypothetical protein
VNFGRRPRRQGQAELVDHQLHFGLGLDVTGQQDRASTRSAPSAGQRSISLRCRHRGRAPPRRPGVRSSSSCRRHRPLARACARIGRESPKFYNLRPSHQHRTPRPRTLSGLGVRGQHEAWLCYAVPGEARDLRAIKMRYISRVVGTNRSPCATECVFARSTPQHLCIVELKYFVVLYDGP